MNTKTINRSYSFNNYVFQKFPLVILKFPILTFYNTLFPIQTVLVAFPIGMEKKGLNIILIVML